MQHFNCERKLACLWNFWKFQNVPQLVAADFNHSLSLNFEKFSKGIFSFVWVHRELDRLIDCLDLRGWLLLYLLLLDRLRSQNDLFWWLLFDSLLLCWLLFCGWVYFFHLRNGSFFRWFWLQLRWNQGLRRGNLRVNYLLDLFLRFLLNQFCWIWMFINFTLGHYLPLRAKWLLNLWI